MQGLGTTCHSIEMTVELIIYVDPADFSTNFCMHSCRLPGSFSKPSCIPWQRTHPTHFLLCLSLAVPSSKEFGVSEKSQSLKMVNVVNTGLSGWWLTQTINLYMGYMSKNIPTKKTDTLHAELPPVLVLVAVGTAMAMFLFFALFGQLWVTMKHKST